MEFDLGSLIPLSDEIVMRFVASDDGGQSIVEAAIDDIEITACPWWVDVTGPTVEIAWPNGGEEIVENSEVEIRWSHDDDYGVRDFTVVASYDGGLTFDDTLGVADGFDTSLVWQVPAGEHEQCKIGIVATDRGYNTTYDESDSAFAIVPDVSGIEPELATELPHEVRLMGSRTNPFTESTHIFFALPQPARVTVRVYDIRGRLVNELFNADADAGYHSAIWDGKTHAGTPAGSGIYLVRLEAVGTARVTKVVLAR
jgi:hypothetical protein